MCRFSHLHVHTQYSLLDGFASAESLFSKAANDNMPAVAITDHGNMFGVFDFVSKAWKKTKVVGKDENGKDIEEPIVKPIVGCEFYVVENRHQKIFTKEKKDDRFHQLLLAKNAVGYQNLIKLTSLGYMEGMYSKYPRIDKELIEQYKEGLIATTCCLGAYVPQTILRNGEEAGEREFKWWLDQFGEDYFIEIQRHNIKEQDLVNKILVKFSNKYNVPIIASNDSHYVNEEDYNAHDILLCVNTGSLQSTPGFDDFVNDEIQSTNKRFKFPNNQFYFKTTDEMKQLFHDLPQAIDNTNMIVDRIEVLNLKKDILLPAFPIPESFKIHLDDNLNQWEYLKHLTYEGAMKRYGSLTPDVQERIDFELHTIRTMGFAGYFLIVGDFIKAGRDLGVFVGPGRGSAAGSAVAYCIGITNIDPIKYNLLFERFLNPERKSMPDIDTDFDDEGRQKVIDYVVEKYGKNQVAQIITYGTMAAKSSIKDVARVMDLPLSESNKLAKLVPDKPGTELKRVLHAPLTAKDGEKSLEEKENYTGEDIENIKQLRKIYESDEAEATILHIAEKLEGSVRNTGIHAAGIIIAPKDLTELIPVATSKDSNLLVTQIEGKVIEESGVIKMDFLGLKTLSIIKNALEMIKENHGVDIDIDAIPLDDEKTYQLFQKGNAVAIFQFEATHLADILRNMKPSNFEDLIALNALNRPGPMQYIPDYIKRKHGQEAVTYDLPEMEEFLKETYGITVYQEQVMLLSQKLAGFSKGKADGLRKAMGKKDRKTLDNMKADFIKGATELGHPEKALEKIWTDWEKFAQYAFNKSHSTCYAFVAYQTAYLKAHYPSEFMAAVLNNAGSIEKITFFMEECKRMGIHVLGPDINESKKGFAANKKGEIRFGLGGLKGVGEAAISNIIEERTKGAFTDVFDFFKRVSLQKVNKKSLECLIMGGCFDGFKDFHRKQYFHIGDGEKLSGLEKLIQYANACNAQSLKTSNTLFGDFAASFEIDKPKIAKCEPWSLVESLNKERDITGMFMSGHPLDNYEFELRHFGIFPLKDFEELKLNERQIEEANNKGIKFRLAGLVTEAQHLISKRGTSFGKLVIEDYTGKSEILLFDTDYQSFKHFFEVDLCVIVTGYFHRQFQKSKIAFKISKINLLENIKTVFTKKLELHIKPDAIDKKMIDFFQQNIEKYPGNLHLRFHIYDETENVGVQLYTLENSVEMNYELTDYLILNKDKIEVTIQEN